ncbi:MAG: ABC transporter permease [Xanthomonadales bacterium]|nr:ABC transporter permease [Xanthomonadales bacterium]
MTELRNAWRRLQSRPGYAALSMTVLGMGLGAMLFLLTAVNGLILRPLPFPDGERLVTIGFQREGNSNVGSMSSADFVRLAPELRSYESIGGYSQMTIVLGLEGGPKRYEGAALSQQMLPMLGAQPVLGRMFTAEDERPGSPPVLLLGHDVWRDDFGADPAVVGRAVRVNGQGGIVAGVMAADFGFPQRQSVWMAKRAYPGSDFSHQMLAKLRPGITLAQARAELDAIAANLGHQLEGLAGDSRLVNQPLHFSFVDATTRGLVWMMFAAGLLVLLLACANVANLQLSQVLGRRRELAVRSALGAGRGRLLRALLVESLLLSLGATVIALGLAQLGGRWVMDTFIAAEDGPAYFISFDIDLRMAGFAALAALLTTVLAGLVPALRASRTDVQDALRDGDKGSSGSGFARVARGLVVAEIALTVVLLVGAGMFIRALQSVLAFDFGTRADPTTIMTGRVGLFPEQFPSPAEQLQFFERVAGRLRADPEVVAATVANTVPGTSSGGWRRFVAEGEPKPAQGFAGALMAPVDPHFADTYQVRLVAGRFFDGRDRPDSDKVAVVDARMAQALWPGVDPLGRRFVVDPETPQATTLTVVGMVEAMHLEDADDTVFPTYLVPFAQQPTRFATLAVRLRGDAAAFGPKLAAHVRAEDADTAVYWQRTQQRAIEMGRVGPVILTQIFTGVGVLALVLSAAGLYGVLAFAVAQRTREIGIRRAIGAGRRGIVGVVGGRVLWQVLLGLAIGVALGLPWSLLLATPEMQTRGLDPLVFSGAIAVVIAVAVVASLAPLRRALRVDPIIALRHE